MTHLKSNPTVVNAEDGEDLENRVAQMVEEGNYVVQMGHTAWVYSDPEDAVNNFMLLGGRCGEAEGMMTGNSVHVTISPITNRLTGLEGLGLFLKKDEAHEIVVILAGLTLAEFRAINPYRTDDQTLQ